MLRPPMQTPAKTQDNNHISIPTSYPQPSLLRAIPSHHTCSSLLSPLLKRQQTVILREYRRKNFNLLTQRRHLVLPVKVHASHSNERDEIELAYCWPIQ